MQQNFEVRPLVELIDIDNGVGFYKNVTCKGFILKYPDSVTSMLYEVKTFTDLNMRVVKINYIHYENITELYSILAFAARWWSQLDNLQLIYYKEKERSNSVGSYLKKMGFRSRKLKEKLKPFHCNIDGDNCDCEVREYYAYCTKK